MLKDADGSNDLALLHDANFAILGLLAGAKVAGVTDDLFCLDGLVAAPHADEFAILVRDDFVDGLVEHVGTAVDGAQTGKGLRKLAEPVERIDIRGLAVAGHGGRIQDDAIVCWPGGFVDVAGKP